MYLYQWKTKISRGSQDTAALDLLEVVSLAIRHGQQFPEITEQSIVNREGKEIVVFRDQSLNGK